MTAARFRSIGFLAGAAALAAYSLYRFRDAVLTFFVLDDFWVLRDASRVRIDSLADVQQLFWFGRQGFRLYRPLTTTAYSYLLQSLFGFDPSGHHAFQLLLFTANVLLVVAVVRRLTGSRRAALAAGLTYLLAPGQAVNATWLSAFTVSGTTLWVLLLLWCWLALRGRARIVICTLLQVCGLLASEHALVAPLLCAIVGLARSERRSEIVATLLPSAILVAAYTIAKLIYLRTAPPSTGAYDLGFSPRSILEQLGRYVCACFNALALQSFDSTTTFWIGMALVVGLALAILGAVRGSAAARLLAAGIALFGASLAPVLALSSHYYDHYIGTAALGMTIALIGLAQLLTRHWPWVTVAAALALLSVDLQTDGRAWRKNEIYQLVVQGSIAAASWVEAVQHVAAEHGQDVEVLVPTDRLTNNIFAVAEAETFFPAMPARVRRVRLGEKIQPAAHQAWAQPRSIMLGQRLPFWAPQRGWLRRLAGARPDDSSPS